MTLRTKTLAMIGVTLICLIATLFGISRFILLRSFAQLEERQVQEHTGRVLRALFHDLSSLETVCRDWAVWDDTYQFMRDGDQDYVKSNLVDDTFTGMDLNLIMFVNASGDIVHAKVFDLINEKEIPLSPDIEEQLRGNGLLSPHADSEKGLNGIVLLREGPMMVAAHPVLSSEKKGPARGALIMARYFDSTQIKHLAERTQLSVRVHEYDDLQIPPDFREARASLSNQRPLVVQPLTSGSVAGYTAIRDIHGRPILLLKLDVSREVYQHAKTCVRYLFASLTASGIVFAGLILLLLEKCVLSPVARLSGAVGTIGSSGDLSARVSVTGKDELSNLARQVNGMLEALQRSDASLRQAQDDLEKRVKERTTQLTIANERLKQEVEERQRAQEALKVSEEKYRILFDNAADLIVVVDPGGNFLDLNQRFEKESGYRRDEMIGKNAFTSGIMTESSASQARSCLKNLPAARQSPAFEVDGVRKDGKMIPYEMRAVPINKDGRKVGIQAILRNIAKRKAAEKEKAELQAQLQQAHKMQAVGTLAGGVAHDFNNLLMGIQARTSLMLMDLDADHPHVARLTGIQNAVEKGADLTRQLLGFARGGKYELMVTDLNRLLKKSSDMFGRTRKELKIHVRYQQKIWPVEVDRRQIEQALLNLYVNASDAMPGAGDLSLETANVTLDKHHAKPFNLKPGNYVRISVTDTGVGMNEATRRRVFEPFFTTKEMGGRVGLGLAFAYGIIQNHGGMINVDSEPGQGTTFHIYLPASNKELPEDREPPVEVLRGTETVLLVDDEDVILETGREMLMRLGYKVVLADSGKQAIEHYKEHKGRIDVVILDMIMPEMGGDETYEGLKEINADIKVLLSSGYSIDGQANEMLQRGCDGFIQKPFNVKKLSLKLREVLDGQ